MSDDSLVTYCTDSNNTGFPGGALYCSGSDGSGNNDNNHNNSTTSKYNSQDTLNITNRQEFIAIVKDISGYLSALKKIGIVSCDLSMESADIISRWNNLHKSVLDRTTSAVINKPAYGKLSFLSLQGHGDLNARLFFIICNKKMNNKKTGDEKPAMHKPIGAYQGDAGALFLKILKAMKLDKDSVYTSCITIPDRSDISIPEQLKYQKTAGLNKISMEIDICMDLIKKKIDSVCPEVICCLGDFAVKVFLGSNYPLSISRGRFYDYKGIKVMPTFHPASLIMDTSKKRYVWDDMQKIMSFLGI